MNVYKVDEITENFKQTVLPLGRTRKTTTLIATKL
jgi:hypothetical protein